MFSDTPTSVRVWQVVFVLIALSNLPGVFGSSDSSLAGWMGFLAFGLFSASYEFRHRRVVAATNGDVQKMGRIELATGIVGGALIVTRLCMRLATG